MKNLKFFWAIIIANLTLNLPVYPKQESDTLKTYEKPGIIITGNRAIEGISPIPFSNLSKTTIDKIYIAEDTPELLTELPSIISYSESGNNIGYSYITMRGFSQHRIAVYINGIPQNGPEDHNVYWIDMPDLPSSAENMQVQRGAGIINYGAASIGGSINIETVQQHNEPGVKIITGLGWQEYSYNNKIQPIMNKYSIQASSGRIGDVSVYARLSAINSNGYRDNMWANLKSYYLSAGHYTDNFTTHINVFGGPITDGLGYYGLPKEYIKDKKLRRANPSYWEYNSDAKKIDYFANRRKQEIEEFSQPHFEILNKWIGTGFIFESALFYYTGEGFFVYDGSWADEILTEWVKQDYQFTNGQSFKNSLLKGTVINKQGGWIPRIYFEHPGGDLSIGAEIRFHRSKHFGNIIYSEILPENYDPDYKFYYDEGIRNIYSLFISENLHLSDNLTLNLAGQLVNQVYQLQNIKQGNNYIQFLNSDGQLIDSKDKPLFDISYLFFNPRTSLNFKLNNKINLYTMLAYTSREPRMSNLLDAEALYYGSIPQFESDTANGQFMYDFTKPLVKPESMIDIELGSNYIEKNFTLGINFYWMEYFNELVSTGILDLWGRPVDGNVPRTRHIGLELQANAILFNSDYGNFSISGNATISKNEIIEFDYKVNTDDGIKTINLSGNQVAGFPALLLKLRLNYQLSDFNASLSSRLVGDFKSDNFGDLLKDQNIRPLLADYLDNNIDAYTVFNLDLSYDLKNILLFKNVKLQARINNLTNELYASMGHGKTFFPAAERSYYFGFIFDLK